MYVDIWLLVWMRLIVLGLDMMRQLAPETLNLDRVFGFGRVTAAGRRVLEADPSWNNGLTGEWRGCKNDFGRAVGHRAGLDCWGWHAGRQRWPEKLCVWMADSVGYELVG